MKNNKEKFNKDIEKVLGKTNFNLSELFSSVESFWKILRELKKTAIISGKR